MITFDMHVHCGQFRDTYYHPEAVMAALKKNGIKHIWISSTTSCIPWNNADEKEQLIHAIYEEIEQVCFFAEKERLQVTPLYWVVPRRHFEGESVEDIMDGSLYKGFKVHPQTPDWNGEGDVKRLFREICYYAAKHDYPILIHTGEDEITRPARFEEYFREFPNVRFVLAHCKDASAILSLFRKYENLRGDTAFCPIESYREICRAGFANRMLRGTDFPIPEWYKRQRKNSAPSVKYLTEWYKKILEMNHNLADF